MTLHDFHRPLGSTGFNVSPLGLGTVKLGRDQGGEIPPMVLLFLMISKP